MKTVKTKIFHSFDENIWDEFVFNHPQSSIYHTSLWAQIVKISYGWPSLYVISTDNEDKIVSGMIFFEVKSKISGKKLSSIPCAQYSNPLTETQNDYESLIKNIIEYSIQKKIKKIEIRTTENFNLCTDKFGGILDGFSTYILPLDKSIKEIKSATHKSCIQRAIKKSYNNNLRLIKCSSEKDVKEFYKIYLNMRKTYGLVPQPYKFFLTMWRILSTHNFIDIYLCSLKETIVSGILLLKYKDTVIYEYGASLPDALNQNVSHFLLWEAIQHAKQNRYKQFDFGRTSDDNAGLTKFKARWGTNRLHLPYYFIPEVGGVAAWRQKSLAKKIMNFIVKNLSDWSNQLVGQAIYKHLI